ncbi:MAG: radical SAM protein [Thermodesulfobacteriota bacterium]
MGDNHPEDIPAAVYANHKGEIFDLPDFYMAGRSGNFFSLPEKNDLIPLPEESELFILPERSPIGIDRLSREPVLLEDDPENKHQTISGVAAFMAPAHTAIFTAAYEKKHPGAAPLPLFCYAAVGWLDGRFWVTGFRSDPDQRQDFSDTPQDLIRKKTSQKLQKNPDNRLIQHLGKCCLTYGCPAAKNFFLERHEAPLPTSPSCNACCVGCISLQSSGSCPATQDRLKFIPSPEEIAEIAVPHLQQVPRAVVSFGQGCEGEPLLQAETLEKSIRLIRKHTDKGTINLNTNASLPQAVNRLAETGLDSIRVSTNSARKGCHTLYYRPRDFNFKDVLESIRIMKEHGRFVSLNYFIFPGFTDDEEEFEALISMLSEYKPNFIQLRNLNIDPDLYLETVRHQPRRKPMGIRRWHEKTKEIFPDLGFGYFNPPLR